jgi:hypothetical protein
MYNLGNGTVAASPEATTARRTPQYNEKCTPDGASLFMAQR